MQEEEVVEPNAGATEPERTAGEKGTEEEVEPNTRTTNLENTTGEQEPATRDNIDSLQETMKPEKTSVVPRYEVLIRMQIKAIICTSRALISYS